MFNLKFILSISIFSLLLTLTSVIKNQTRIIEKEIKIYYQEIAELKKDLYESELDYAYVSSPKNISKKIKSFSQVNYVPMDYSRIYLNYNDFIQSQRKISILKTQNEKKIQKK